MKAFVTGGSGFLGKYLVPMLIERGYKVCALARSEQSAGILRGLGAEVVRGDILNPQSLHAGIAGSDVVFHLAAWYKLGNADQANAESINVNGTRNVLTIATELGVPKIVYTSTIAVFGDTGGVMVDETHVPPEGPFLTEYDRTKWMAHYRVALPLIAKGAPIVIVQPGLLYGPGDTSSMGKMMRMFFKGQMPAIPAPELTVTWAHVEDAAEGHILAAEKGKIGESYILAGPAIPLGEMVGFWSRITGIPAPRVKVPARAVRPFAPVAGIIESKIDLPDLFSREAMLSSGATYIARSDKARNELGWQLRPPQAGMLETFDWLAQHEKPLIVYQRQRKIAGIILSIAFTLFSLWLLQQRNNRKQM